MFESNQRANVQMQTLAENSYTIFAQTSRNEAAKHSSGIADFKQELSQ